MIVKSRNVYRHKTWHLLYSVKASLLSKKVVIDKRWVILRERKLGGNNITFKILGRVKEDI